MRGLTASEAARLGGAMACRSSVKGALRWVAQCETEASIPPTTTRTAELGARKRTAAPLARTGQHDGHGQPDGVAAACVPILAVDADAATMAGREQQGRARPVRRLRDMLVPILRKKCDRVGEAGVPISASVMQPIFNRVAEQHGVIGQAPIALDVLRDGVRRAPFLHH